VVVVNASLCIAGTASFLELRQHIARFVLPTVKNVQQDEVALG
jgi:hypothetical protein